MGSKFSKLWVLPLFVSLLTPYLGAQGPFSGDAFAASSAASGGNSWLDVSFPNDSPVLIVSSGLGSTTAHVRGSSIALEIHTSLLLRNTGAKPINGLTLQVVAHDLEPAGKGSVTVPSLDVQPGDVFPVRIDMEVIRPFNVQRAQSPLVQVSLDCALFNDMTAYGPDKLGSKRALMVYELEARRDRRYYAALLNSGRIAELRKELDFGIEGFDLPHLAMELLRGPEVGLGADRMSFGVVSFPSAPVEALGGAARVVRNEVDGPMIELRNRTRRPIATVEMGWILRDPQGRDFLAGSTPEKIRLAPVETAQVQQPGAMRFLRQTGQPLPIEQLLAFVNSVQFQDGSMWIPSRQDIGQSTSNPVLQRELLLSPEQQRLASLYRRKGMVALASDLRRAN